MFWQVLSIRAKTLNITNFSVSNVKNELKGKTAVHLTFL